MWLRIPMVLAGAIAALFVARDAPNVEAVEGMIAVAVIAAAVVVLALTQRR